MMIVFATESNKALARWLGFRLLSTHSKRHLYKLTGFTWLSVLPCILMISNRALAARNAKVKLK